MEAAEANGDGPQLELMEDGEELSDEDGPYGGAGGPGVCEPMVSEAWDYGVGIIALEGQPESEILLVSVGNPDEAHTAGLGVVVLPGPALPRKKVDRAVLQASVVGRVLRGGLRSRSADDASKVGNLTIQVCMLVVEMDDVGPALYKVTPTGRVSTEFIATDGTPALPYAQDVVNQVAKLRISRAQGVAAPEADSAAPAARAGAAGDGGASADAAVVVADAGGGDHAGDSRAPGSAATAARPLGGPEPAKAGKAKGSAKPDLQQLVAAEVAAAFAKAGMTNPGAQGGTSLAGKATPLAAPEPPPGFLGGPSQGASPGGASSSRFPGIDPAAVRECRAAGISDEQIGKFATILACGPGGLADRANVKEKATAPATHAGLDAAVRDGGGAAAGPGDVAVGTPVERSVELLTKVVQDLASAKKTGNPLDHVGESGPVPGESGSSGFRNIEAGRRLAETWLQWEPERIYSEMERLMSEEMPAASLGRDGLAPPRLWAEQRSHTQNYKLNVFHMWQMCGVWQDLMRVEDPGIHVRRARARAALAVAAAEQISGDHGSLMFAEQIVLERPPPYGAFDAHPELRDGSFSPILDPRMASLHVARARSQDDLRERRKRLMAPGATGADGAAPKNQAKPPWWRKKKDGAGGAAPKAAAAKKE